MRIKEGGIHRYDLIDCDGKRRAFMTSVGIEGTVAQLRNQYIARGATGIKAYIKSVIHAYFKTYKLHSLSRLYKIIAVGNAKIGVAGVQRRCQSLRVLCPTLV
jgi:hypothetical protein